MGKSGQRPLTVTELCGELGRDENINILYRLPYAYSFSLNLLKWSLTSKECSAIHTFFS